MTPALLNKYIDAARTVSEHLLLTPKGIDFAPHPVVTDTDRDKYCVRRIIEFYQRQNTSLKSYFFACHQLRSRGAKPHGLLAEGSVPISDLAGEQGLSAKYLCSVWDLLHSDALALGPTAKLQAMFNALPADADGAVEGCRKMEEYVREIRPLLGFDFPHLRVNGMNRGSQTLVLWRNRQRASHRMVLNEDIWLQDGATQPAAGETATVSGEGNGADRKSVAASLPEELQLPGSEFERLRHMDALKYFCRIFPDKFYVDRRGREYLDQDQGSSAESEVRLLSAGFHSMMGYFRDDQPLCELLLTEQQLQELDRLWFELDFIADAPARQHAGFIWFERAEGRYLVDQEFDAFRSEDREAGSEAMLGRLAELYIAKAKRLDASPRALEAINEHFRISNENIRRLEQAWRRARALQIAALADFAQRAYRRPLSSQEREETIAFYHQLVERDGLTHQDAMRDVLVSILMSPHFCYRIQESRIPEPIHALSPFALASRLSYFLWASMPDEELLACAADESLLELPVLQAQAARMLRDPKARGLAVEFAGNWLGFRHFQSHNSVDRNRFPQFKDPLRQAMFEEPVQFTLDIFQNNRSILEFLYARHTYVNPELAKHYGMEGVGDAEQAWVRVDDAAAVGRGGILPMAVFMTSNSPGLRTSPVKRGYWVVRQLLGEHIPAPPPDVPELPSDESQLGELTLRQVLEKHREHASCAACHEKFDSFGLVFEGYGPVGERRQFDLAGNQVDVSAELPDGSMRAGLDGLRSI
jgi:hypothetical protein